MNKKGISAIIATVLIVLLTVAAVTILWIAIAPLVEKNLGSGSTCFRIQNKLSIDVNKKYTCWNISGNENQIKIMVVRDANTPSLAGFQIILDDNGNSVVNDSFANDATITNNELTEKGKKLYTFTLSSNLVGPVEVSIAPRASHEGKITSCAPTSPFEVKQC